MHFVFWYDPSGFKSWRSCLGRTRLPQQGQSFQYVFDFFKCSINQLHSAHQDSFTLSFTVSELFIIFLTSFMDVFLFLTFFFF